MLNCRIWAAWPSQATTKKNFQPPICPWHWKPHARPISVASSQPHDRGGKDRVAEALKLGAQRLIGGTAALQDQALVLQLRAHRLPVLLLPTAQVVTGAARSMAQHPLKKMKEAGIFTTIGTGWPTLLGTSLTAEFEALSKHHQWRLDDIRNATTRAVEAAFMGPTLRFQLARTIEIWRHRPFAGPAPKGDSWSL